MMKLAAERRNRIALLGARFGAGKKNRLKKSDKKSKSIGGEWGRLVRRSGLLTAKLHAEHGEPRDVEEAHSAAEARQGGAQIVRPLA